MGEVFTLRKGTVIEIKSSSLYIIQDLFTKMKILMSISGKQHLNGLKLEIDEIVYVIVSPYDLSRGRLFSEQQVKHLNIDFQSLKKKLDAGEDPLITKSFKAPPSKKQSWAKIRENLLNSGWKEIRPNCVFENAHYEIVLDTSSYAEIYDKKSGKRIAEGLSSNLYNLLIKLKTGEVRNDAKE